MRRLTYVFTVVIALQATLAAFGGGQAAPKGGPSYDEVIGSPQAHIGKTVTWVVRAGNLEIAVAPSGAATPVRTLFELRETSGNWKGRILHAPPFKDITSKLGSAAMDPAANGQARLLMGTIAGVETVLDAKQRPVTVPVLRDVTIDALPADLQIFEPGKGSGASWPMVLKEVKPKYTTEAMAAKIQGEVTLQILVAADGTVASVEVTKSLEPGLDQAAVAAAREWKFAPGRMADKPVASRVYLVLEFRLGK